MIKFLKNIATKLSQPIIIISVAITIGYIVFSITTAATNNSMTGMFAATLASAIVVYLCRE